MTEMNTAARAGAARLRRRAAMAGMVAVAVVVLSATGAGAQGDLSFNPSSDGLPGAGGIRTMMGWAGWGALIACVLAVIYGGATWAWGNLQGGYNQVGRGRGFVVGGLIGAACVGIASILVSTVFTTTNTGATPAAVQDE